MGWSNVEELVCVAEDGAVYVYDMFGDFKKQFTLGLVSVMQTILYHCYHTIDAKYFCDKF